MWAAAVSPSIVEAMERFSALPDFEWSIVPGLIWRQSRSLEGTSRGEELFVPRQGKPMPRDRKISSSIDIC